MYVAVNTHNIRIHSSNLHTYLRMCVYKFTCALTRKHFFFMYMRPHTLKHSYVRICVLPQKRDKNIKTYYKVNSNALPAGQSGIRSAIERTFIRTRLQAQQREKCLTQTIPH